MANIYDRIPRDSRFIMESGHSGENLATLSALHRRARSGDVDNEVTSLLSRPFDRNPRISAGAQHPLPTYLSLEMKRAKSGEVDQIIDQRFAAPFELESTFPTMFEDLSGSGRISPRATVLFHGDDMSGSRPDLYRKQEMVPSTHSAFGKTHERYVVFPKTLVTLISSVFNGHCNFTAHKQ